MNCRDGGNLDYATWGNLNGPCIFDFNGLHVCESDQIQRYHWFVCGFSRYKRMISEIRKDERC